MTLKAALFDLDGTLIDTVPDLTRGVNWLLSTLGKDPLTIGEVGSMIGKGASVLLERALSSRDLKVDKKTLDSYLSSYTDWMVRHGSENSILFPYVFEGLTTLREKGIKVALVTNKPRNMTLSVLKEKAMERLFDTVITPEDVATPKPAADMPLLACQRLGVAPNEAVMVGDSTNDALAGRNAGMRTILVSEGFNEGISIQAWAKENGFDVPLDSIDAVVRQLIAWQRETVAKA